MAGENNLETLLRSMQPSLLDDVYCFSTWPAGDAIPTHLAPVMMFREAEAVTLILTEDSARKAGLQMVFPCRMITLNIHSALEAVGFLAAILPRLAAAGMGVNPVSAFYHDHLFVPADRANDAMAILRALIAEHA